MYSLHEAGECWCHVTHAERPLVEAAVTGNLVRLGAAPLEELEAAMASLDWCRKDECRLHGGEHEARQRLDAAWDELLGEDESDGCDRCRSSMGCAACLGLSEGGV